MKITDPDIIQTGEQDLIQAIQEDLDLNAVREILENKLKASTLNPKGGEIVVHNNEIAFRIDFQINLSGSLMFDRDGNYISESSDSSPVDIEGSTQELTEPEYSLEEGTDDKDQSDKDPDDSDQDDSSMDPALENEILDGSPEPDTDDENEESLVAPPTKTDELEKEVQDNESLNQDEKNELDDMEVQEQPEQEDEELHIDTDLDEILKESEDKETDTETSIVPDEDIDNILQESREFWEQDKDS